MSVIYKNLRSESTKEAYEYFDQNIRSLPKNSIGEIELSSTDTHNTELDAFRHAYTSGRFTQRYSEEIADILGRMNELLGGNPDAEKNMDLWNNEVGRKCGKKTKSKQELASQLKKALERGELIITPADSRKFKGNISQYLPNSERPLVVIDESKTGRNQRFVDILTGRIMTLEKITQEIHNGDYAGYYLSNSGQILAPASKPDKTTVNNLG